MNLLDGRGLSQYYRRVTNRMASIHRKFLSPYWYCQFRSADGRWLKRSTKLEDRKKALAWCLALQEAQDKISRGSPSEAQMREIIGETMKRITGQELRNYTVRQWLEQWLDSKEGANTGSTVKRYRQAVNEFLAFLGQKADGRLDSVEQRDVIDFRKHLREQGKSAPTINLVLSRIVAAPFRQALNQRLIAANPLAGIPRLSERGGERKQAFTIEQVRKLLDAVDGEWKGAILAAYTTGARLGDIANMRWQDVDLRQGVIAFTQGKTQTEAVIGLHPDFETYLRNAEAQKGPIFPSLAGRHSSGRNGLSTEFASIMERAGIEAGKIREKQGKKGRSVRALSFHSFRHGAASHVFKSKLIEQAQKHVTGHSRGETLKRYTHVDLDAVKAASSLIPRL
jgi:integrase